MVTRSRARRRASRAALARAAAAALAAALALGGAGCAPRGMARPPAVTGYAGRAPQAAALDAPALRGRRIVLDPGHGGGFPGARGPRGLTEAEVNLSVALHLRDLLAAHGAEVVLTRDTDRDLRTPADSSLRGDLAARVRLANDVAPDAFVSIHHNAHPDGRDDVNETVTYYRLGDEGASLDLAEHVHRALVRGVGIRPHRVVAGNYAVLRGTTAPAILTETSYLTNPRVERRLARDDKRRLEAAALFRGLAAYFARGAPAIDALRAETADGVPALRARVRGAFDRVDLRVDGVPVAPRVAGAELSWEAPDDLAPGDHEATLVVGLAGSGSSPVARAAFRREAPWNQFTLEAERWPRRLPAVGGLVAARVVAVDAWGRRLATGLGLRVTAADSADAPRDTLLRFEDGEAWLPLRVAPRPADATGDAPATFTARVVPPPGAGEYPPEAPVAVPRAAPGESPAVRGVALRALPADTALVPLSRRGAGERDAPSGIRFPRGADDWATPLGLGEAMLDEAGVPRPARLPGYRPWGDVAADGDATQRWVAIAGGALHGRRIALDPEGGGERSGGAGPGGSRGAALNLEVARALAAMLEAAGAEVRLVRDGDAAVADLERVRAAERFGADRYLRIAHRAGPPLLGHYFSSAGGRRWADGIARELARLGLPAPPVGAAADAPVQQAAATAVSAALARVDDDAAEARLLAPGTLRAEALALYLALAREWAPGAEWPADSLEVRDAAGRPLPGVALTLGGALVLETDALGRARFARTEPGPIVVEADDPRIWARRVLAESDRGVVLTGPTGR